MTEYYGIYDNKLKRWLVNGNSIVHYPHKEIAEAHFLMVKSAFNDYSVKSFGQAVQTPQIEEVKQSHKKKNNK